jgi:hypothetical protein
MRPRIVPKSPSAPPDADPLTTATDRAASDKRPGCRYRSWAELLRTLGIDARTCPSCQGPMRLLSLVTEPNEVRRFLQALGEPTEPPKRAPPRGPPFWASRALRIRCGADAA